MEDNNILHNYQDWLEHHKMPAGKKKTLIAAIELFSQQGYSGTSTAQIAKKADISQATIFKYFKTKSDLLSEIMQPMIPELKRAFLPQLKTYTHLKEAIHFIVQDRFQFLAQNADLIKILIQEALVNKKLRNTLLVNIQLSITSDLVDYWQTLKQNNPQINPDLTEMEVIRTNVGLLFAYFAQRFILNIASSSEEQDLKLIEKQILTFLTT
ncbi:TetR/AcrR family transcriptional regulator [Streptococcus macacae]|uniref:Transcriptional regulator, TetR family n=1 Tax=Streptococcus macacae NCTC 11558 TaxID=764298 RepID=G5JVA4_9STRE|nr:TetR/AcrR family transcriptional regulator [Streptococcus macacae]EHJ52730.1 transcriptional regulator, TetR family [Streptococcus macacae NCTC 11558]SUN77730.1 transcriptional regulator [Streptococcus macacae NCTC 11558]